MKKIILKSLLVAGVISNFDALGVPFTPLPNGDSSSGSSTTVTDTALKSLQDEVERLKAENASLKEEGSKGAHATEVFKLKTELQSKNAALERITQNFRELSAEYSKSSLEKIDYKTQYEIQKAQYEASQKMVEAYKARMVAVDSSLHEKEAEISALQEKYIKVLGEANQWKCANSNYNEFDIAKAQEKQVLAEAEKTEALLKVSQLEEQLAEIKKSYEETFEEIQDKLCCVLDYKGKDTTGLNEEDIFSIFSIFDSMRL